MPTNSQRFRFEGGAGTYIGTGLLALLITVLTIGICYPFALVLKERWRAKHSYIGGHRLVFTGSAWGLFGNWIKWLLLSFITIGIYLLWVGPRIEQWKWEHTAFEDPSVTPYVVAGGATSGYGPQSAGPLPPHPGYGYPTS